MFKSWTKLLEQLIKPIEIKEIFLYNKSRGVRILRKLLTILMRIANAKVDLYKYLARSIRTRRNYVNQ